MLQKLELQVCSTGETLASEETELSAVRWQKKTEKRLLRYKRTSQKVREAIAGGDTIVGWVNSWGSTPEEIKRVFRGYDKFFESRRTNA